MNCLAVGVLITVGASVTSRPLARLDRAAAV